ncbi:MAG: tryptophan synthase subunit alpha [Bacteroidetes bacterium]|nr:MAG: tryptophan synthase subunit alpha [Bacteroidota bacterium]
MGKLSNHRIVDLIEKNNRGILSIYFTAGYPNLEDTMAIALHLQKSGADLIEIGIPYSDPVADGPTIQESNQRALENGMDLELLMAQLKSTRADIDIPIILMGYFNPILQYGVERFCADCQQRGIDGLIIPDLPVQEYLTHYQHIFKQHDLHNIFLITPQTSEARIRWIDENSESFIYAVSDSSITGAKRDINDRQIAYFERLQSMKLKHPFIIGFGISDQKTFNLACKFAKGAIIGSAFINVLREATDLEPAIHQFVQSVKNH